MVHILPPPDWTADAAAQPAPPAPAEPVPVQPVVASATTFSNLPATPSATENFETNDLLVTTTFLAPPTDVEPVSMPNAGATLQGDVFPAVGDAPLTLLDRALAQPILLWGGIAAALLFAGGFSTAMWLTRKQAPTVASATVAAAPAEALPVATTDANSPLADREELASSELEQPSSASPQTPAAPSETEPSPTEQPQPTPVVEQPSDDAVKLADQPSLPALPSQEPPQTTTMSTESTVDAPEEKSPLAAQAPVADQSTQHIMKFDPLNFDPLALGLSSGKAAQPGAAKQPVSSTAAIGELPPPTAENEDLPSDEELFREPLNQSITAQRGPSSAVELPDVDVAQQLALQVDSIDMPSATLDDFLRSIAQLADVPITLDPAALRMAGVSPRDIIAVRARHTTLEKLLRDTLKRQRLDFITPTGQIVIVRPGIEQRRSVDYDLSDLVETGSADASQLAAMLQRFVAPQTWQKNGGQGAVKVEGAKLVVDQSHGVHYQTLIFFERLRRARDLAPTSQYPVRLLSVDSPYMLISERLRETTTFTFLPWTPLDEVFDHWRQATRLAILVDWAALDAIGLAPSSSVSCSAIERHWGDALTTILDEFGLAWYMVDGQTIQITSQNVATRSQQIEFYSLAPAFRDQFSSDDALVNALETELEEKLPPRIGSAPAQLAVDAPSARLIVLASPVAHRFLSQRLGDVVADHVAKTTSVATPEQILAQPLP